MRWIGGLVIVVVVLLLSVRARAQVVEVVPASPVPPVRAVPVPVEPAGEVAAPVVVVEPAAAVVAVETVAAEPSPPAAGGTVLLMVAAERRGELQEALAVELAGRGLGVLPVDAPVGSDASERAASAYQAVTLSGAAGAVWVDPAGEGGLFVRAVGPSSAEARFAPLPAPYHRLAQRVFAAVAASLLEELASPPAMPVILRVEVSVDAAEAPPPPPEPPAIPPLEVTGMPPGAWEAERVPVVFGGDLVPYVGSSSLYEGTDRRWVSLNLIGLAGAIAGFEVGAVGNIDLFGLDGFQLAGAFNFVGRGVSGFQLAGAVNLAGGPLDGFVVAGGANLGWAQTRGLTLSGGANLGWGDLVGAQITGGLNLAWGEVIGLQLAGGVNAAAGRLHGLQVAGGVNYAGTGADEEDPNEPSVVGAQIGAANVAVGDLAGTQIGAVNVATGNVSGVQIGAVNVAENADFAVGLVNVYWKGRLHLDLWGNDLGMLHVGLKHGGRYFHWIYTLGVSLTEEAWTFGLGMGAHWPVHERVFLDIDVLAHRLMDSAGWDLLNVLGQARIVVGVQLLPWLAVTGGLSYNVWATDRYDRSLALFGESVDVVRDGPTTVATWPGFQLGVQFL